MVTPVLAAFFDSLHHNFAKLNTQSDLDLSVPFFTYISAKMFSRQSSFGGAAERRSSFSNVGSRRGSHSTCFEGDLERVKLLVQVGTNMDEPDANGWTPIFAAADRGHSDVVKYLCEVGVDMEKCSSDGKKKGEDQISHVLSFQSLSSTCSCQCNFLSSLPRMDSFDHGRQKRSYGSRPGSCRKWCRQKQSRQQWYHTVAGSDQEKQPGHCQVVSRGQSGY